MARTCGPAGSMVMTMSPAAAASAALAAGLPPAATRLSSAPALRSKPVTSWPAFSRLAAIGPPILPRPMKPIAVMPSSLCECQLALTDGPKIGGDILLVYRGKAGGLPLRRLILVDQHG